MCKICKEWEKEANRHKEVARELSIKLAEAREEIEILKSQRPKAGEER